MPNPLPPLPQEQDPSAVAALPPEASAKHTELEAKASHVGLGVILTPHSPAHIAAHAIERRPPLSESVIDRAPDPVTEQTLQAVAASAFEAFTSQANIVNPLVLYLHEQVILRRNKQIIDFITPGHVGGESCFLHNAHMFFNLVNEPTGLDPEAMIYKFKEKMTEEDFQKALTTLSYHKKAGLFNSSSAHKPTHFVVPIAPQPNATPAPALAMTPPQLQAHYVQTHKLHQQVNTHLLQYAQTMGIQLKTTEDEKKEVTSPSLISTSQKTTTEGPKIASTKPIQPQSSQKTHGSFTAPKSPIQTKEEKLLKEQDERIKQGNEFMTSQKRSAEKVTDEHRQKRRKLGK